MNKQDRTAAHGRFCDDLDAILDDIRNELVDKNRKYGDSALSPANVFSKATSIEQIKVRLDDKLARKVSDQLDEDEDIDRDIMGYLVLLRIAQKRLCEQMGEAYAALRPATLDDAYAERAGYSTSLGAQVT